MYTTPKTLHNSPTITEMIHKVRCFDELLEALQYALRNVNASECDINYIKRVITKAQGVKP